MPMGIPWTDETYREAIIAAHSRWKREEYGTGSPPRRAFCVRYLQRAGLGNPTFHYRRNGRFDAILAACPEDVRRDFRVLSAGWTAERILAALQESYALWRADRAAGKTSLRWSPSYLKTRRLGECVVHMLNTSRIPIEIYLQRIGGSIIDDWYHRRHWKLEEMRSEFRRIHRAWAAEKIRGKQMRRGFDYTYILSVNRPLLLAIERHYRGGMQAFVRALPDVYRDWSRQTFRSDAEIRDDVFKLHYAWVREDSGRTAGFVFGPRYLQFRGRKDLAQAIESRGTRRIFSGHESAPAALAWRRIVPGVSQVSLVALRRRLRMIALLRRKVAATHG